ncbi:MAG: acetyl-coenzyme A synthetase N-terminal domain-containing protein, partial [Hyphomicrobium sp.]|nr:acetyl-coenzyme A synthetase N-terminal domain-containing protein [Hyphomicrobium sp.]
MSGKLHPVPGEWTERAWINQSSYRTLYERSLAEPQGFWREIGQRIDWIKPYTKVKNTS